MALTDPRSQACYPVAERVARACTASMTIIMPNLPQGPMTSCRLSSRAMGMDDITVSDAVGQENARSPAS